MEVERDFVLSSTALVSNRHSGVPVILIILIVALSLLRFLEIGFFADLSWWWIVGLVVVAVLWFEVFEKMFGLDRKRAHESLEQAREERKQRTFGSDKKR